MAITSLDILNLSHSLKDICEVNCNTPECLSQTLKILMQYNLIQANLQFSKQFGPPCMPTFCQPAQAATVSVDAPSACPGPAVIAPTAHPSACSVPAVSAPAVAAPNSCPVGCSPAPAPAPAAFGPAASPKAPDTAAPSLSAPGQDVNPLTQRPSVRLDIGDPFLDDYER